MTDTPIEETESPQALTDQEKDLLSTILDGPFPVLTEQEKQLKALRHAFAQDRISLRPQVNCKDCTNKNIDCRKHKKAECPDCGAWTSTSHIHLDYIGHADVTDRLLEVDQFWNWEPVAYDERGLPLIDKEWGGLWIKLTIAGVTRIGFGDANVHAWRPKGDALKEMIGDAIRNAAMRFGVGLDLWRKDPEATEFRSTMARPGDSEPKAERPAQARTESVRPVSAAPSGDGANIDRVAAVCDRMDKADNIRELNAIVQDAINMKPKPLDTEMKLMQEVWAERKAFLEGGS